MNDTQNPVIKMTNICKTYPGVKALQNVNFDLRAGEVHSICGENGAGKSTLIKILTGAETYDEIANCHIYLDGSEIAPKSTQQAQELGISTVYQEVNLCPNLTVAENIFVGRQPMIGAAVDWKKMTVLAEKAMRRLNLKLDVTAPLNEYSVAIQQMVAIVRAVDVNAKVLVLDEPTSSLNQNEVKNLFKIIRKLRASGMGIVFISHFLDQTYEISDRITILRNGQHIGTYEAANLDRFQLISHMIGKDLKEMEASIKEAGALEAESITDEVVYSAQDLGRSGTISPFSFEVHKGEVMGFAGLLGSGRTESANLIFGVEKPNSGEMKIHGKSVKIHSPRAAVAHGIGLCPENRKTEGLVTGMTIRENIALALQSKIGMFKHMSKARQTELANKYIELLSISTPGPEQLVGNLSGGNQQKVLLAKWLATDPDLLILDEPTRGIDIGTKTEIQKLVLKLAGQGMAVIFISSELEEEIRCCNVISVYKDKRKIAELRGNEISEYNILNTIAKEGVENGNAS